MNVDNDWLDPIDSYDLLFVGDCSLKSNYWGTDPCTDEVRATISEAGFSTANFEVPLKSGVPIEKFGTPLFTDDSVPSVLRDLGFDAVSLGNNHILDYGVSGLEKTINECQNSDLEPFGAGINEEEAFKPTVASIDGASVALVSACEFENSAADGSTAGAAWTHSPKFYSKLQSIVSENDVTILLAHGGLEYTPIPPRKWRKHLRTLSTTGVDVIIGHHPHCIQGWEKYQDTPIFYSVGNFLMHSPDWPSTKRSLGVQLKLDDDGIDNIGVVLFSAQNGEVSVMSGDHQTKYFEYLQHSSNIIENDTIHDAYWQEIAHRIYFSKYSRYQYHYRFKEYGVNRVFSFIYDPVRELDRLTSGLKGSEYIRRKQLIIRDKMYSSHRDAIQTALGVETGVEEDLRNTEVETRTDWLLRFSDGRPDRTLAEKTTDRVKTALHRLFSRN